MFYRARPINLHLKGFEALGAKVTNKDNCYIVEADELIGNNIYLDFASVGATINIMLAAVKKLKEKQLLIMQLKNQK